MCHFPYSCVVAVIAGALLQCLPASATENGNEWNDTESERFAKAEKVFAEIRSRFRAEVQEIIPDKDGTTRVVFHATGRYGEERNFDKVVEKVSKEYALTWNERDRPIPWVAQQQVNLGIRGAELLYVHTGIVMPQYFRYAPNGEVELLVRDENQRPFLVRPHKLGSMADYGIGIDWLKGLGVVMTNYEAGPGDFEVEASSRHGAGIVPVNAPGRSVQLGRDGWRTIKSVQPGDDPKEGNIGHYRKLVPASQRIKCAG
jgi:hypothetical protein